MRGMLAIAPEPVIPASCRCVQVVHDSGVRSGRDHAFGLPGQATDPRRFAEFQYPATCSWSFRLRDILDDPLQLLGNQGPGVRWFLAWGSLFIPVSLDMGPLG